MQTGFLQIPNWFSADNQGGGIVVADLKGDGTQDLIVFMIDNPPGQNRGVYQIGRGLDANARTSTVVAAECTQLRRTARTYIDRRLAATQRVAEFQGYERLFSLWHALHIPLIFMLIIAAVVHVIAVNVY